MKAKTKPKKQKKKKENKVNIYQPTFNTINNIIFIGSICFVNSKALFIILLHSKHCLQIMCLFVFVFFFYLGFLSRTFTIHRTAGEGGGYFFNSPLPLPPASQTLRH